MSRRAKPSLDTEKRRLVPVLILCYIERESIKTKCQIDGLIITNHRDDWLEGRGNHSGELPASGQYMAVIYGTPAGNLPEERWENYRLPQ